jgi:hypothetical protein
MQRNRDARPERIPWLLKAAWIFVPGVLILFAASPVSTNFGYVLIEMPIALLVWIATIVWTARCFIRVGRSQWSWRRMDTVAVVPTAVIIAIVSFLPILHVGNYIGGAVRFALTQADYDKEVSLLPVDDKPRIRIFNWGGMIWVSRGIVYDDSDEIALPKGRQSKAWLD